MGSKLFFLVLICLQLENHHSFGDDACKRCRTSRTHGMKSVDCYNKDIRNFPTCYSSDVEILELSTNRIRKVNREDLNQFSYLKFLYLKDNLLTTMQNDTFEDMNKLQALDLSQNNIKMVPASVFKLPSLKTVYLSQNLELNLDSSLENIKPILSPITVLDISCSTEESAVRFPDFGPMPYLVSLNISENKYKVLAPRHFAGLCSLKLLINNNVSNYYESGCDCWTINKWLSKREVQFNNFICPVSELDCQNIELNYEDKVSYNKCMEIINAIEKEHRIMKISIGIGVSVLVIIVVLIFVYFYFIRRKRNKKNNPKNVDPPLDGPLLLNNQTKTSGNL